MSDLPVPPGMSQEQAAAIRHQNHQAILDEIFQLRVLEWLRRHHQGAPFEVVGVESVKAYGSDWDGDTEGGFRSSFSVLITYTTTDPAHPRMTRDLEGDDMESLWRFVVGGER